MNVKKVIAILVGIMLLAFGVGLLSLKHYSFGDRETNSINWSLNSIVNNLVRNSNNTSDYIEKNVDEEKIEDIAGVRIIDIDVPFSDVNIIPEDRDDVRIHYHGFIRASFIPRLKTNFSNNTLYIHLKKNPDKSYNTKNIDVRLDIYVPESFEKDIKVDTSFGNITISNFNLSQLELFTSFGDIEINNLTGDIEADTSYGNIVIQKLSGNLIASTSFGNIDLEYSEFDYNIKADTSFGDIKLTLPKNSQFKIDAECSFGDIDIDFPVTITKNERDRISGNVGNSSNSIELESSSGNIEIISK